jgi:eukaryotic-like serine/threonine-protein kinase
MIGRTISHYTILEKLGEGGMGVVYKAHDTKLDRTVALKFLPTHLSTTDEDKKRFIQEARAASSLDHPNICTIHEINETAEGDLVIVMPAYEGISFNKKIAQGPLPIDEVLEITIQTAEGLLAAHEKGIIHRDLKSSNIFLTHKGQVKIIDFGLARKIGATQLTKTGSIVGTAPYMSPEQVRGEMLDRRTDIWSLGVLMYEMIAGRLPFASNYTEAIVYSILNEEPEPLTSVRSNVPMELERIVKKAMQKDVKYRYQSIDELLVDLKSLKKDTGYGRPSDRTTLATKQTGRKAFYIKAGIGILIFLVILGALFFIVPRTPGTEIRSIAVLPLANLSGDPEQEYFSDGMTEALISDLARISALRVISRTSVMQYKGTHKSMPEIARELNVDAVIEGSVMRSGQQIRITAQLIEARSDKHVWASRYTRELSDILMLQSDVARAIADEIKIQITPHEWSVLTDVGQVNPDAYETTLKGRYFWNRRTPESLIRAIEFYQQAVTIDPNYAEAYRGLGASYAVLGVFFADPREVFPKAVANMEKALELDANVIGGNLGLGVYHMNYMWDRQAAERFIDRAVELHPGFDHVYNVRGMYLASVGRGEEAIGEFQKALRLDPLSLTINGDFGWAYYTLHRFEQAIMQCQKILEMDPDFLISYHIIAASYSQLGEYDKAIELLKSIINNRNGTLVSAPAVLVTELGYALAKSGNTEDAREIIRMLEERTSNEYIDPYLVSLVYVALAEHNDAFIWLEKAVEARSSRMPWLDVEPKFDSIRTDPRFVTFREKVGY